MRFVITLLSLLSISSTVLSAFYEGIVLKTFTLKSAFVLWILVLAFAGFKAQAKYNSHFKTSPNFPFQILVKEGFSTQGILPAQGSAWASTFMLEFTSLDSNNFDQRNGSTSVVYKLIEQNGTYLGLITNKHVFRPLTEYGLLIYENIKLYNSQSLPMRKNSYDVFAKVDPLFSKISPDYDLAFLVIKVPAQHAQNTEPIKLTSDCNLNVGSPLATIGFPNQELRKSFASEEILKTKRWSSGVYLGNTYQITNGPAVGTTIDALPGSSGGPVINKNGELVGIMTAGISYDYQGSDEESHLQVHSYMVDCQATKTFIESSWKKFLEQKQTGI